MCLAWGPAELLWVGMYSPGSGLKHRGRCVQLHSLFPGPGMPQRWHLGKPGWGVGRVGFCAGCPSLLGMRGQMSEEAAKGWQKLLFLCKSVQHFVFWLRSRPPQGFEIIWEEKLSIRLPSVVLLQERNILWQHPFLTPWKAWGWKAPPKERHNFCHRWCALLMVAAWQALAKWQICPKAGRKRKGGFLQSEQGSQQAQVSRRWSVSSISLPEEFGERTVSSCKGKLKPSSARGQFQLLLLLPSYQGFGLQHQHHHQRPSPAQGRQALLAWGATSRGK